LTGGLASGKTTVAAFLARLGAAVFDADEIVAELYRPGAAGETTARDLFGDSILDASGIVDRGKLARLVFADPASRLALESRIHPLVGTEIERCFAQAERGGARVAVAEASQLLEAGTESRYDRVLVVVAPEEERLRRWNEKGGDVEDARRRFGAQLPADQARLRAHDVLVNDGTLGELEEKVETLYRRWTA